MVRSTSVALVPTDLNIRCRSGVVDEFRRPSVPKSMYQIRLEAEADDTAEDEDDKTIGISEVRYWSDYSRVFYHPRTAQRLSDVADYENKEGDWIAGQDAFTKYNEVR